MGKIITFQSPLHGQCGTTVTMVATAYAMKHPGNSICMVHSQSSYSDLENLFFTRMENQAIYNGIGLDSLCYTIKARDLERNDFDKAMIEIEEGLHLLPSVAKRIDPEREDILKYIITEKLPLYYDYVLVDINAGRSETEEAIQKAAEKNIYVVSQSRQVLDRIDADNLDKNKTLFICGDYDANRKLNLIALRKMFPKHKVFAIPHCSEYGDAIADSRVKRFFQFNEKLLTTPASQQKMSLFQLKPSSSLEQFFNKLLELKKYFSPTEKTVEKKPFNRQEEGDTP